VGLKGGVKRGVHKCTDSFLPKWDDRYTPKKTWIAANPMLFIIVTLLVLVAVVIIRGMRVTGATNNVQLGWMSEHWLAEHRALHSA